MYIYILCKLILPSKIRTKYMLFMYILFLSVYLDELLDRVPVGLVELLGVELDVGLACHELDNCPDENDPILEK